MPAEHELGRPNRWLALFFAIVVKTNQPVPSIYGQARAGRAGPYPIGVGVSGHHKIGQAGQLISAMIVDLDPTLLRPPAPGGHICGPIFVCIGAGYGCLFVVLGWLGRWCGLVGLPDPVFVTRWSEIAVNCVTIVSKNPELAA